MNWSFARSIICKATEDHVFPFLARRYGAIRNIMFLQFTPALMTTGRFKIRWISTRLVDLRVADSAKIGQLKNGRMFFRCLNALLKGSHSNMVWTSSITINWIFLWSNCWKTPSWISLPNKVSGVKIATNGRWSLELKDQLLSIDRLWMKYQSACL